MADEERRANDRTELDRRHKETNQALAEKKRLAQAEAEAKLKGDQEKARVAEEARRKEAEEKMKRDAERAAKDEEERQKKLSQEQEASKQNEIDQAKGTYKTHFYAVNQFENKLAEENGRLSGAQSKLKQSTKEFDDTRKQAVKMVRDLSQHYQVDLTPTSSTTRVTTTGANSVTNSNGTVQPPNSTSTQTTMVYDNNWENDPWAEYERMKLRIEAKTKTAVMTTNENNDAAMAKFKARREAAKAEIDRSNTASAKATQEIAATQGKLAEAKANLDKCKATLDKHGIRPDEIVSKSGGAAKPKEGDPNAASSLPVFVLKDGRKIKVAMSVDGGDTYTVKDDAGKMHTIEKSDVAEIVKPK